MPCGIVIRGPTVNLSHSKSRIQVICSDLTGNHIKRIKMIYYWAAGTSKLDEARRKREEKKIQRQRELEARRVARGPLKLGAKKL